MFCGTGSFKHVDEDRRSPPSSPSSKAKKASKNPYSTRGLDKYSTLVAELEARKAKIMEEVGPQEPESSTTAASAALPMVWFVYSNTGDWTPVVVRLREDHEKIRRSSDHANKPLLLPQSPLAEHKYTEAAGREDASPPNAASVRAAAEVEVKGWSSWRKWRPSYSWPLVMVLILVCLLMFGRMFAICCTSIWWYLVPLMEDSEHERSSRRSLNWRKKKDYRRRLSDHSRKIKTTLVAQGRRP